MRSTKRKSAWVDNLSEVKYLPSELWPDILHKLPVKTLLKFREWHPRVGSKFSIHRTDTFCKIDYLFKIPQSYLLGGSCNGLILMENREKPNEMILWNPSIRKSLILPPCPVLGHKLYCLGFTPSNNDYKVFVFCGKEVGKMMLTAVYSLNNQLWRVQTPNPGIAQNLGLSRKSWSGHGNGYVICGGAMYWIVSDPHKTDSQVCFKLGTHLVSFDFEVEEFSFKQLSDAMKDSIVMFVFLFGESVGVFTMSFESNCIWVLEKDGGEDPWRLWFSGKPDVNASKLLEPYSSAFSKIIYVQKSKTFLINTTGFTVSYNIASHKIQRLGKSFRGQASLDTYVESLVLHKGFPGQTLTSFP
ncbi:F-box/kelch-repeat protein At3g23880 isoform X2 [Spinacia oleracea]|uniref:F-box/kelch-repeat protein At3g23880 isoform X2 n=1 Tax=Spinacia oleracea TaxID=3562 RepID=A0ABM3QL18_SPIOL|nr:F-box/kelch-repeat protein At3g23880-like isoform X2 [Spinacia oleracea]